MNNIIMDLEVRANQFVDECVPIDACIEQKTETKKAYLSGMVDAIALLANISQIEDDNELETALNSIREQAMIIVDKLTLNAYQNDYIYQPNLSQIEYNG